jgi:hypothetical protein
MAPHQLRKVLRRPAYVVYLFVQPVIFVLRFRYVFGGAIRGPHTSYVSYLMPGPHRQRRPRPDHRPCDALGPALGALAWLVGLLVVSVPLAVRTFRRA